eukprot:6038617-Pleurochrysis_carterae.AAC.1
MSTKRAKAEGSSRRKRTAVGVKEGEGKKRRWNRERGGGVLEWSSRGFGLGWPSQRNHHTAQEEGFGLGVGRGRRGAVSPSPWEESPPPVRCTLSRAHALSDPPSLRPSAPHAPPSPSDAPHAPRAHKLYQPCHHHRHRLQPQLRR